MQQKQVYGLIRSKAFYDARFQKKWLLIVDGTQTYLLPDKLKENASVILKLFGKKHPVSIGLSTLFQTTFLRLFCLYYVGITLLLVQAVFSVCAVRYNGRLSLVERIRAADWLFSYGTAV